MNIHDFVSALSGGMLDNTLTELYGNTETEVLKQRVRYISMAENFSGLYPEHDEIHVFSVPACVRIGGTNSCILSAAVTYDMTAIAAANDCNIMRIKINRLDTVSILPDSDNKKCSPLVRRVLDIADVFRKYGIETGGFDIYISSEIPSGFELSESDAFDVLVSGVINVLYSGSRCGIDYKSVNKKVCFSGGFVSAGFRNPQPEINPVSFDFLNTGYSLCITVTGYDNTGSENDCPHISEDGFYEDIAELRKNEYSDKLISEAVCFLDENERSLMEAEALRKGRLNDFFRLINESGDSSAFVQKNFSAVLAFMISRKVLHGNGAVRIYKNTVQAFVPSYTAKYYAEEINNIFGEGSCKIMGIRSMGFTEITGG